MLDKQTLYVKTHAVSSNRYNMLISKKKLFKELFKAVMKKNWI